MARLGQLPKSISQGKLSALVGLTVGVCLLGVTSCTTPPAPNAETSSPPAESPMMPTSDPEVQANQSQGQQLPISAKAELGGQEILLEVAETPEQQAMGLMYRPALADDRGMLFPMTRPRPVSFWMMNVPVPLDMVFVYQGRIRGIAASAPPCTASPCPTYGPGNQLVDHVIELRGGRAAELGLAVGDPVAITRLAEPVP
ncbi:DUF192 domain-containing protein [Pseudanabaena sp. FACHB-2040]|nr:DUF192 domain-containing protein [Pseudanabaena sp. FACHB-2040]